MAPETNGCSDEEYDAVTKEQTLHAIEERDIAIAHLQDRVASLSLQLQASLQKQRSQQRMGRIKSDGTKDSGIGRPNKKTVALDAVIVDHNPGKHSVSSRKERMGVAASFTTRNVLEQLSLKQQIADSNDPVNKRIIPPVVQRILEMFAKPTEYMEYLKSKLFAKDLLKLCKVVGTMLEQTEPRVVFIQSPVYVFGDIHGNIEDLHFFSDNIWRLGMNLTAGNFLFLGDYVDRGMSCLETVAYLFALKHQLPTKVYLLRGNHETRDVNGWEEYYKDRAFLSQCRSRFGDSVGHTLWEACNRVFDRLPLAAVIDQDIFCVHGGIPRPVNAEKTTRIQDILTVPTVAGINPPYEHESETYQQVASDCIWSDPASEEQEMTSVDPDTGYGASLRGGGAICFGNKAVSDFLQQQDFSYIMRAHEAHAEGVAISKGARVFTVFSTSKDHHQGSHAMAGCILVDDDKLQVINRSPAYKNQYVHSRDSFSLKGLSATEIQQRIELGLVTVTPPVITDEDDDYDEEGDSQVAETWKDLLYSDDDNDADDGSGGGLCVADTSKVDEDESQQEDENLRRTSTDSTRRKSIDVWTLTSVINDIGLGDSNSRLDKSVNSPDSRWPKNEFSRSSRNSGVFASILESEEG